MSRGQKERRLVAVLAADMVGYSGLLGTDESGTLARCRSSLAALGTKTRKHGGRVVKTMGDGLLATFPSTMQALLCAVEFQRGMVTRNASTPDAERVFFRIGVTSGDAVLRDGDLFGEPVVLASRLEALAPPGQIFVSARVREDAQGRSSITFEDVGEHRLKNIDRAVRVYGVRLDGPAPKTQPMRNDRPSIAVLPFDNLSGDPDQEYFADGLTEDIISALSRWRWFFVIARNSSFTYKGRAVDVKQVGRELGVRYVLEGSVRKAGSRVRVVAQLIDATDGAHVWADTFDRDIADLFALQDELTEHVVNAIEPAMLQSEGARAARRNLTDLSAFDCFQRGMWRLNQLSAAAFSEAMTLFREAIERDPELSVAYSGLARVLYGTVAYGWSDDPERESRLAAEAARAAIKRDPRDAWAHFALSGALLHLGQHDQALEEALRTIKLNSNFAYGHFRHGQVLIYCGRAREASAPIERSIRHSPFDSQIAGMHATLALAHFHAGEFDAAASRALESARLGNVRGSAILAAALARLGRTEEAKQALSDAGPTRAARALGPLIPYARASDLQDLLDALRLAGLEEPLVARLDGAAAPRG